MKYTKKQLKGKEFFIMVDRALLERIVEVFPEFKEKLTCKELTCIGFNNEWMNDNGNYYRDSGYTEVFPEELEFLQLEYEIY